MDEENKNTASAPAEDTKEVNPPKENEPKAEEKATPAPKEENKPALEDVEIPTKFKTLVDSIDKMSVLDLHELVKLLEKKFGVSAATVAVAGPAAGAGAGDEEKSVFNVELADAGAQKIAVIKAVKEVLGLGLKEAKDLVDGAPSMLKEGMKKADANELKTKIETAGGKVNLK